MEISPLDRSILKLVLLDPDLRKTRKEVDFKAPNGVPSSFGLNLLQVLGQRIVLVSQTGKGMSVTNASETIANVVAENLGKGMAEEAIFIEHYPDCPTWDIVEYKWEDGRASDPKWKFLKLLW